jgi:alkenylglycerophosphocholine hydrolase
VACLSFLQVLVLVLAVLASFFSIWVRYRNEPLYSLAKPIPLFLIIALFFVDLVSNSSAAVFPFLVFLGLIAGVGGDILLLFPRRFLAGLIAFLLGHLLYIAGFAAATPYTLPLSVSLIPFAFTGFFGATLLGKMPTPERKKYTVPILVYMVAVTLVFVTALNFDRSTGLGLPLFTLGSLLFCISDGVLAWNKFARPFRSAQGIILFTYYTAQILIGFRAMCFL